MKCMMNVNGCGRKWLCPDLKYCPEISLKGLRKIMKRYGSQSSAQVLNLYSATGC
jgi:hypothetical protein